MKQKDNLKTGYSTWLNLLMTKPLNGLQMLIICAILLLASNGYSQTYYTMSSGNYLEDFNDISNTTNWPNGFNGPSSTEWRGLAVNATGTIPSALRLTTATNVTLIAAPSSSGGVQKNTNKIQLLSTGATVNSTSAAIELYLDFTGRTAGTLAFDAATVFNSTGDRTGTLRVYASTDGTTYTELTGTNLPYTATNNVAGSASITSIALPVAFDNAANARLRFYYHNGPASGTTPNGSAGSRPIISLDNISVTSTPLGGPPSVNLSVNSNTGSETAATVITVTATASAPVTGDQTVDLAVTGTNITGGDYTLSSGTITILSGATTGTATFTIVDDAANEGPETAVITMSNPSAGLILGSTLVQNIAITDNDAPNISLSLSANSGTESGSTVITVTATANVATIADETVNLAVTGTGITAGDYTLSNTQITILNGGTTGTVTFTIVNDNIQEALETATLTISSPTGGYILGTPTTLNVSITDNDDVFALNLLDVAEPTITFDELANTGTSSILGTGIYFLEHGGSANTTYVASDGSTGTGNTYSFGTGTQSDRAIGMIESSGTDTNRVGIKLLNNTGGPINAIEISYTGEQWRNGGNGSADVLYFQYSKTATSLVGYANYNSLNSLNFTSLINTVTAAALDGNAPANRTTNINDIVSIGTIPSGSTFWIRWQGNNIGGNDHGLSVDDVTITPKFITPLVFFSKSSGNLDDVNTWGNNPDGSGISPTNFTTAGQIFNVVNQASATIGANWTVSGGASKVVVGDGIAATTLTIPASFSYTGTIDVTANGNLILANPSSPTFGVIDANSTVTYAAATGTQNVDATTYGNLTLVGAGTKNILGNISVQGNIILDGTDLNKSAAGFVSIQYAGNININSACTYQTGFRSNVSFVTTGNGNQVITGNGNSLSCSQFNCLTKTTGSLELSTTGGSTTINTNDDIKMNLPLGVTFTDNGNNINVGGDFETDGQTASYLLTGTLTMTGVATGAVNLRLNGTGGSGVAGRAEINNLVIACATSNQFNFQPITGTGSSTIIKGDLTIAGTSGYTNKIVLGSTTPSNTIKIAGNYYNTLLTDVITQGTSTLELNGTGAQTFACDVTGGESLYNVVINKASGSFTNSDAITCTAGGKFTLVQGSSAGAQIVAPTVDLQSGDISNIITGTSNITKTTTGTVTVSAINTNTGTTNVSNGTLKGVCSLRSLSVNTAGVLSPGTSPGIISATNTTFGPDGTMQWELDNTVGTAGTNWDLLAITGSLNITATQTNPFVIDVRDLGAPISNFNNINTYTWVIASTTTGITGFAANKFFVETSGFDVFNPMGNNIFTLTVVGNDLVLKFSNSVANDIICGAISLNVAQYEPTFSTYTTALANTNNPAAACGGNYHDVWFKAVVPASGNIVVAFNQVTGSGLRDNSCSIYRTTAPVSDCTGALTLVACNDEGGPNVGGTGDLAYLYASGMNVGETVFIRVAGKNSSNDGQFSIGLSEAVVWKGNTTSWSTPANWYGSPDASVAPISSTDVIIPNTTVKPIVSSFSSVRDLRVQNGSTITLTGSGSNLAFTGNASTYGTANPNLVRVKSTSIPGSSTSEPEFQVSVSAASPSINGTWLVDNFTKIGVSTLTVQSTASLQITNLLRNNGGSITTNDKLVVRSIEGYYNGENFGTGQVIAGAGTYTGNVVIERKVASTTYSTSHYVSSPISNSNTVATNYGDDFSVVGSPSNYLYTAQTAFQPTVWPTTWYYDVININPVAPAQGGTQWRNGIAKTMDAGIGFSVTMPGNRVIDVAGTPQASATITLNSSVLASGNNLVGNPYPSSIDIDNFLGANGGNLASNAVYYFNNGNYVIRTTGSQSPLAGAVQGSGLDARTIGNARFMGHSTGFWVVMSTPSLTFTSSMRNYDNGGGMFFNDDEPSLLRLQVRESAQQTNFDECVLGVKENAEDGKDNTDIEKLMFAGETHPYIYTVADGYNTVYNYLSANNEGKIIPIGVVAPSAGNWTIGLDNSSAEFVNAQSTLMLEDRSTSPSTFYNLKTNANVQFSLPEGNVGNRFYLHIGDTKANTVKAIAKANNEVSIYSNSNKLFVNFGTEEGVTSVEVFSLVGQRMVSLDATSYQGLREINMSNAAAGAYLVKVTKGDKVYTEKVFIDKK